MPMDYAEATAYIESFINYESYVPRTYDERTYGLDRMARLLSALGEPHRELVCIHVAGTNGKGSVCAMAESVLRVSGLRTGLFTSPHLIEPRERIRLDGVAVSPEQFAAQVACIRQAVDALPGEAAPTFFELYTALALRLFWQQKVDVAVVEVGMGGRLDSTNVLSPAVSVITSVGLDHAAHLGGTLPQVAREKAGIIKTGVPVVCGISANDPAAQPALEVIRGVSTRCGSELWLRDAEFGGTRRPAGGVDLWVGPRRFDTPVLGLAGTFQAANAATAVASLVRLEDSRAVRVPGWRLRGSDVSAGLTSVQWPGRFQVVRPPGWPVVVLDGAMNAEAASALRQALEDRFPGRRIVFVIAMSADKQPVEFARALFPGLARALIVTRAQTPRAMPVEDLREAVLCVLGPGVAVGAASTVVEALDAARQASGDDGVVCLTGSLYLVGEALACLDGLEG